MNGKNNTIYSLFLSKLITNYGKEGIASFIDTH